VRELKPDQRILDHPDLLTGYVAGTNNGWKAGYRSLWDVILTHRHYILEEGKSDEFMAGYDAAMDLVREEMELYGISLPKSGEGTLYFSEGDSKGEEK
jgi:hypothetical protein